MIGFRGPPAKDRDTLVLDVIQYALTVGEGSRLNRELVYGKQLAASVAMDWSWRIDPGTLLFYLELKPDSNPAEVEAALYAELAKVANDGIGLLELQKAKNNLNAHFLRGLATNNGRANAYGTYELMLGSWQAGLELPAIYEQITLDEVKAVAAKYFGPEKRSVVTLIPAADANVAPEERS